jgi:nucleoside-diphosphate-sugar epimerase
MTERGHVLVTGGSGFVGSAIVRELLAHGFRLRLAVRDPRQAASLGDTVSAAVIGDLAEPVDWSRHLEGIDAVVHAAGLAHAETKSAAKQLFKVNAEATDRLMQAARRAGVRATVYISSVRAVTGTRYDELVTEDHAPQPTNDYGRSKLDGERAVAASGLSGTILRPPLVHGANVRGNLALLARAAALPLPLPLGGLTAPRSIVSDRNLASAVAHVLERPPDGLVTALVADTSPLTATEIVTLLRRSLGRDPGLIAAPGPLSLLFAAVNRRQHWDSLAGRLELAPARLAATGWRPVESSDAGLARTMRAIQGS